MHLIGMETATARDAAAHDTSGHLASSVVTLAQLADELSVPVKTLYDLRSKGRGPRGFRIGRELRFRRGEVEAWLSDLEADDARRHPRRERG